MMNQEQDKKEKTQEKERKQRKEEELVKEDSLKKFKDARSVFENKLPSSSKSSKEEDSSVWQKTKGFFSIK